MATSPQEHAERLGQLVRMVWDTWARQQPDVAEHSSWTVPWERMAERDKDVDRRIGLALYALGAADVLEGTDLVAVRREDLAALIAEFRACVCPHEMCPVDPHPATRKLAGQIGWVPPEGEQL